MLPPVCLCVVGWLEGLAPVAPRRSRSLIAFRHHMGQRRMPSSLTRAFLSLAYSTPPPHTHTNKPRIRMTQPTLAAFFGKKGGSKRPLEEQEGNKAASAKEGTADAAATAAVAQQGASKKPALGGKSEDGACVVRSVVGGIGPFRRDAPHPHKHASSSPRTRTHPTHTGETTTTTTTTTTVVITTKQTMTTTIELSAELAVHPVLQPLAGMDDGWRQVVIAEAAKPYFGRLLQFLSQEAKSKQVRGSALPCGALCLVPVSCDANHTHTQNRRCTRPTRWRSTRSRSAAGRTCAWSSSDRTPTTGPTRRTASPSPSCPRRRPRRAS